MSALNCCIEDFLICYCESRHFSIAEATRIYRLIRPYAKYIPDSFPILDAIDPFTELNWILGLLERNCQDSSEQHDLQLRINRSKTCDAALDLAAKIYVNLLRNNFEVEASEFARQLETFVAERELSLRLTR